VNAAPDNLLEKGYIYLYLVTSPASFVRVSIPVLPTTICSRKYKKHVPTLSWQ
jgi:hypothetical protein